MRASLANALFSKALFPAAATVSVLLNRPPSGT